MDDSIAAQAARSEAAELATYVFLRHSYPLADQPLAIALATGAMALEASKELTRRQGLIAGGGPIDGAGRLGVDVPDESSPDLPDAGSANTGALIDEIGLGDDDENEMDIDEVESRRVFEELGAWAPEVSDYFVLDAGIAEDRALCWQITERTQWTFDPDGRWTTPGTEDVRAWVLDVATLNSGEWALDDALHGMFESPEDAYQRVDEITHAIEPDASQTLKADRPG